MVFELYPNPKNSPFEKLKTAPTIGQNQRLELRFFSNMSRPQNSFRFAPSFTGPQMVLGPGPKKWLRMALTVINVFKCFKCITHVQIFYHFFSLSFSLNLSQPSFNPNPHLN